MIKMKLFQQFNFLKTSLKLVKFLELANMHPLAPLHLEDWKFMQKSVRFNDILI